MVRREGFARRHYHLVTLIILLIIIVIIIIINTLIIIIIIIISGSSSRSIIVISSIFNIITSTSSPLSLSSLSSSSSSSSLQNHVHHHHRRRHRYYNCLEQSMLKKRWSICQIRWDTVVILFHNLQKRSSLKKGSILIIMRKILRSRKVLYIDHNDCGTVYVFSLLNYIYMYNLLNFLKPWMLIPSKHCIVLYVDRKKIYIYFRRILSKQSPIPNQKKEEGHLVLGYHSQEMSASLLSGKASIQCLQEYPTHFLFQLHDQIALWTRLHVILVICIIILPLNSRPEKKIWTGNFGN